MQVIYKNYRILAKTNKLSIRKYRHMRIKIISKTRKTTKPIQHENRLLAVNNSSWDRFADKSLSVIDSIVMPRPFDRCQHTAEQNVER
jgi:hypothetical protein